MKTDDTRDKFTCGESKLGDITQIVLFFLMKTKGQSSVREGILLMGSKISHLQIESLSDRIVQVFSDQGQAR